MDWRCLGVRGEGRLSFRGVGVRVRRRIPGGWGCDFDGVDDGGVVGPMGLVGVPVVFRFEDFVGRAYDGGAIAF